MQIHVFRRGLLRGLLPCAVNGKRQPDNKRRAYVFLAAQLNGAAHQRDNVLHDRKPQPRAGVAGGRFLALLRKWLKRALLELLAHTQPGVRADKLKPRGVAVAA